MGTPGMGYPRCELPPVWVPPVWVTPGVGYPRCGLPPGTGAPTAQKVFPGQKEGGRYTCEDMYTLPGLQAQEGHHQDTLSLPHWCIPRGQNARRS